MSEIASIASDAVSAYQRTLGTISNNIANAATPGYSRQEVTLAANPVSKVGNVYMGTGVSVEGVKRQYDSFVEANYRNSNSDLLSQEPMVNYTNRIVDVLGSDNMGLSSALDQFFNAARNLSTDPASSALRGSFMGDAKSLTSRFGEISSQLDLVQEETTQAVNSYLDQMNTITSALAQVNGQLTKQKSLSAQPADLLDQRDNLLKSLSDFTHVNTRFAENGAVTVSLGPSFVRDVVVQGSQALNIGSNYNSAAPEKVSLVTDPYGKAEPLTSITSGKLAGLLSFREQVLGSSRAALDTLAKSFVNQVNQIQNAGIDAYGNTGADLFKFDANAVSVAGSLQVVFDDPMRIAAAAQFRIAEAANNTSGSQATVGFVMPSLGGPAALTQVLTNNAAASVKFTVTPGRPITPVATVPNGTQNINLLMNGAAGQNLQVFTRDGRQLVGSALDTAQVGLLVNTDNGFASGATYSAHYLNVSGSEGYKDLKVFYGARAPVRLQAQWDMQEADVEKQTALAPTPMPALLEGSAIPSGLTGTAVAAGALVLNGTSLGALSVASGNTLQASDVSNWINQANITGLRATASNVLKFSPSQINLSKPLTLNGQLIDLSGVSTMSEFAAAINNTAGIQLNAAIDADGNLLITNSPGYEGQDIKVTGSIPNALGLANGIYTGKVAITRDLIAGADTPIELGLGSNGTPDDLSKLGLRTGAYIQGQPNEDLLVFVTGAGEAKLSATYSGSPIDPRQALRKQPLQIKFDAADHYTIVDTATNTVVASQKFDTSKLNDGISYQGLQVSFTSPPKTGDVFTIDGNRDGTGNNQNMLDLVDLQKAPVMGSGKTFSEAYIDQVNDMGNVARQASIAQAALKVVNDQAVSARDQVSGVSMDQEAADLIRFQQAYQASAKVLQVASQIFDSILQVR